jgi:hypothetical protein
VKPGAFKAIWVLNRVQLVQPPHLALAVAVRSGRLHLVGEVVLAPAASHRLLFLLLAIGGVVPRLVFIDELFIRVVVGVILVLAVQVAFESSKA